MYTILLVDDEKIELEALAEFIPWEDMGIQVVGTAKNGRDALLKVEQLNPDIILTDVRMPIMDGLEFSRRARQQNKQVRIVFLSGHDEFQYIKAALSVEAAGYLLKPIDMEELRNLMEKVKLKCAEARMSKQSSEVLKEKWIRELLNEEKVEIRSELANKISQLPSSYPLRACYTVAYLTIDRSYGTLKNQAVNESLVSLYRQVSHFIDQLLQLEQPSSLLIRLQEDSYVVIYYRRSESIPFEREQWNQHLLLRVSEELPVTLTIGLSYDGRGLEDLPLLITAAKKANAHKFYIGKGKVIPIENVQESVMYELNLSPVIDELRYSLSHLKKSETEKIILDLFTMLRNRTVHHDLICSTALHVATSVEQHFIIVWKEAKFSSLLASEWKTISTLETIDEMEEHVLGVCLNILAKMEEKDTDKNLHVVHSIMDFINRTFHQSLSIERIAKEVYLSPNYIGSIFKEKTGETILEYVTRRRIEQAAELLTDKSLKIHEIAAAVGYENVSYFCSIFQKNKGTTPNEYRKKLLS